MNKNLNTERNMLYLSMAIAIISVICYQILQKSISVHVNPAVSLIITYTVAIVCSVILYFVIPSKGNMAEAIKNANYASYLLGIAVVGIEIGFLFIYRKGWKLGLAAPFSSTVTNILLISIGMLVFKEQLSGLKIIGLIFCIIGIVLISLK